MYTDKTARSEVNCDLDCKQTFVITVDHLDDEAAFEIKTSMQETWITIADLMEIKRAVNKALRDHKAGFKS